MNYVHVPGTHVEDAWIAGPAARRRAAEGAVQPMKWNLRLAAANRGIWKASELQRMLADRGLVISAGKMSGLWSGRPGQHQARRPRRHLRRAGLRRRGAADPRAGQGASRGKEQDGQAGRGLGRAGRRGDPATARRPIAAAGLSLVAGPGTALQLRRLPGLGRDERSCCAGPAGLGGTSIPASRAALAAAGAPVKNGYCRLCWHRPADRPRPPEACPAARCSVLQDGEAWLPPAVLRLDAAPRPGKPGPPARVAAVARPARRRRLPGGRPPLGPAQAVRGIAARLHPVRRATLHADPATRGWPAHSTSPARAAEARGWQRGLRHRRPPGADHRAVPATSHGDTVRYSEIIPLQQARASAPGEPPRCSRRWACWTMTGALSFEDWLERKLDGLAPGIRADTEAWLRTMRDGGPRSRPRAIATAGTTCPHPAGAAGMVVSVRPPARGHPRRRPAVLGRAARIPPRPTPW